MPDLSLVAMVTRPELALAELFLEDPANGYQVIDVGPGAASWRRETVKSPWVHGETLVNAVRDVQVASLGVRVTGTTAAQKETRLDALIDAFSQFRYQVAVWINGVGYGWICQPADWSTGESGAFNKYHEMVHMTEVTFSIPREPIQTGGPL